MSVHYVIPFDLVRQLFEVRTMDGDQHVIAKYTDFLKLIQLMISTIEVDAEWYLKQNPDVAAACQAGQVKSAQQHFVRSGYFEGRLPFEIKVDEAWYLEQYPDVAKEIESGAVSSAQEHFFISGHREGRLPAPNIESLIAVDAAGSGVA